MSRHRGPGGPEQAACGRSLPHTEGSRPPARRSHQALERAIREPGREQLSRRDSGLETKQSQERRLDPGGLVFVRHVLANGGGDPGPRRRLVVALDETRATANHLAERPEGDPFAVRWAPAGVPPDPADQAVDVFEELPGETGLANPAGSDDADEPRPTLARRRVEELLELP